MVSRHVVTLANSIVGVSVLAMPFCFKQCGIVLATLSLMMGAVITRMVCYFLVKAAVMNRRRTYEMLAWSTFGQTGKFMVEISIIGFLIGTLIAFMVVIGDLGPEILSEIFSVENNSSLRTIIMTGLSLFVALPLGLLRNIDSLSSVSTASVLFYLFLVIKIFSEGIGPLWSGEYLERIHFWKSAGVLQCIPIFSMALSCQTQIFGIYDALPEPSLQKMNDIVKQAVTICTFFYFCVGFFGYIAFSHQNFGGNILLSFTPTWSTQLIKSMFLMSVVFSVPLVVFPCRASLHSLIFKSASAYHHVHDITTNYIPESRMKFLTVTIVGFTLVIGILIPNIELVLGLVGSTTGTVICIIFPSIMFVRVTSKNTTERLLAQAIFIIGVTLMLLTTYATLYAAEQSQTQLKESIPEQVRVTEKLLKPVPREDIQLNSPVSKPSNDNIQQIHAVDVEPKIPEKMISKDNQVVSKIDSRNDKQDHRKSDSVNSKIEVSSKSPPKVDKIPPKLEPEPEPEPARLPKIESEKTILKHDDQRVQERPNDIPIKPGSEDPVQPHEAHKADTIQEKDAKDETKKEYVEKHVAEAFLKRLEEHQENQKKLLEEQKEILAELKQHHAQDVQEKLQEENRDQKKEEEDKNPPEETKKLPETEVKVVQQSEQEKAKVAPDSASKMIQDQEKIIEKISENIDRENRNAQLLEKLEEGLNKEVKEIQSQGDLESKSRRIDAVAGVVSPKDIESPLPPQKLLKKMEVVKESIQISGRDNTNKIDKDKGVLVGSLGIPRKEPVVDQKDIRSSNDIPSKEPQREREQLAVSEKLAAAHPPVNARKHISPEPDIEIKHKVEVSSPSSKKTASESVPKEKEKVDREM